MGFETTIMSSTSLPGVNLQVKAGKNYIYLHYMQEALETRSFTAGDYIYEYGQVYLAWRKKTGLNLDHSFRSLAKTKEILFGKVDFWTHQKNVFTV